MKYNKPKRLALSIAMVMLFSAAACQPNSIQSPANGKLEEQVYPTGVLLPSGAVMASGLVSDYRLQVVEQFTIQAVEDAHQENVDQNVAEFKQDLTDGKVINYYQTPAFSILLAAGSEGSAFTSTESITAHAETGAVFARAVVFNQDHPQSETFKGQFSNGRFFFDQTPDQRITPLNTTYLLALDLNFEVVVFKGQLQAGDGSTQLAAGSEGSAIFAVDDSLQASNIEQFQKALDVFKLENKAYSQTVRNLEFVPPFDPLRLAWTETFARLIRAYGPEMRHGLDRMRGLPRNQLYVTWKRLMNRVSKRWEEDCGEPVPDAGQLYPQRLPDVSAIPQGYHSEALDAVVSEIPEMQAELAAQIDFPPPARFAEESFDAFLARYQVSHGEIFEKHNWVDEFAPPDCVKPIIAQPPPPQEENE